MSGLGELLMYPTVTSFRPPSGMRCDGRLLSSFITGALTATTVTLFLIRVVPGTYVVLPCDPTITARPVLSEEYFDHIEKQEVFPDDSLIDAQPLHSHGGKETTTLHGKKSRPHKKMKKKKKAPHQEDISRQKLNSKVNTETTKDIADGPKDLQQQLKDLQEQENSLGGSIWSVDMKQQPKQKRKMQDQLQIKQHLEELQMHLRKQSEDIRHKLEEEQKKKKKVPSGWTYEGKLGTQKSTTGYWKHREEKTKSENEIRLQIEKNELPVRRKRESYPVKTSDHTNVQNKPKNFKRSPDSKLLQAIMKEKGSIIPKNSNVSNKMLNRQKERQRFEVFKRELQDATITSVPKFNRTRHLEIQSSQVPVSP